jgi:hypothetical protein
LTAQEAKRSELIDGMELQEIQHEELDPRRHRLRSVGVQKL